MSADSASPRPAGSSSLRGNVNEIACLSPSPADDSVSSADRRIEIAAGQVQRVDITGNLLICCNRALQTRVLSAELHVVR
jgi:hypothetical protein